MVFSSLIPEGGIDGRSIYILAILSIAHWTLFYVLMELEVLSRSVAELAFGPAPVFVGLLAVLYALGTDQGFVNDIPEAEKGTYYVGLVATIIGSAAVVLVAVVS